MILSSPDPAADPFFAAALLALQHEAFEIEAALIGTRELPPLQDDMVSLPAFRGSWITAWDGTSLVGAVAWTDDDRDGVAEIDRVMVHPSAHRRGIASLMVTAMLDRLPGYDVVVTTGSDNPPGIAMYAKHGFETVGEIEVPPGVRLTQLRRSA